jgi:glycosyltransferase involved in cell wall biosynthesis
MPAHFSSLRFAVFQWGARLHYAVPSVLQEMGLLQMVYTDVNASSGVLLHLRWLPTALRPNWLGRAMARALPANVPRQKICSYVLPNLQDALLRRLSPRSVNDAYFAERFEVGPRMLARRAWKRRLDGANAVYTNPCLATRILPELKRRGIYIVLEAISHPFNQLVEHEEMARFGIVHPVPLERLMRNIAFFKEEALLADLVLAASPYVQDGLIELGLDPARIAVVPYGLDSGFFDGSPAPRSGRLLFVGNVGYLKGVPYLAEAARWLKGQGSTSEVRAIGKYDDELIERSEFIGPRYLGHMPRAEVKREFLEADVFVFPTLSDGFGIVLLEAMAAGLPVISTPNCGAVVRDGENGFVVPVRDSAAIADRIEQIITDRALRDELSRGAIATAARFSLRHYRERLVDAITVA